MCFRWQPWTTYNPIHLYSHSHCGLQNILKSWGVLKEFFLSRICPGFLEENGDFVSRTNRKLLPSQTPQKLQSLLQAPIINPNTQKITPLLFLPLAPLWAFSPVFIQTPNSPNLSDNLTGRSSDSNNSTQRHMKYNLWGDGKRIFVFSNTEKTEQRHDNSPQKCKQLLQKGRK